MNSRKTKKFFEGLPFSEGERMGLQAIKGEEKKHFKCRKKENTEKIKASVDIDKTLREQYPQATRWDYAIFYLDGTSRIFFAEVHPAKGSEVDNILIKKYWLTGLLNKSTVKHFTSALKRFYWVPTSGNHILPTSIYYKKLVKAGIQIKTPVFLDADF